MQVKLEKNIPIAASAVAAWSVLSDIRIVAECMPGAEIVEEIDETHYKGRVKLRVGPVTAAFNGDIELKRIDAAAKQLEMYAAGGDGSSAATMNLMAEVRAASAISSELIGVADITINGKLASFGGRMLSQVADQVLKQFGDNFAARAQLAGADIASAPTLHAAPSRELNGLALFWRVLVERLKAVCGGKKVKHP